MKSSVDLLVHCGWLLTDSDSPLQSMRTLAIKNGKIHDIGPTENLTEQYEAPSVLDASNRLVMPGLINTHTHSPMTCFRGLADDLPLMEWLTQHIFPVEACMDQEQIYWSSMLACLEMIRSGTTTFCDGYFFAKQVARAAHESGMRAIVGEAFLQFPTINYGNDIEKGYQYVEEMFAQFKSHPRIDVALLPHAPYTCTDEILKRCAEMARKNEALLHIHLCETQQEVQDSLSKLGMTPVQYLDSLGVLGPNVLAAHCVWLEKEDLALLSQRGVGVAHNPESNMKLASGVAPVHEMLEQEIPVGLGTDGCASNNDLDLFGEMRSCALLHKVSQLDSTRLPAQQVLKLATQGGVDVIGKGKQLGSLNPGRLADLITINLQAPHLMPLHNIHSQLVYATRGSDVCDSVIHGKIVMRNQKVLTMDEDEILERMAYYQIKVQKDARLAHG